MKILVCINLIGKNNSQKVCKLFERSQIPFHNSIICIQDGPDKRLNGDIPINSIGLNFRVNEKDIHNIMENDSCVIEVEDENFSVSVKDLVTQYLDCDWEILKEKTIIDSL